MSCSSTKLIGVLALNKARVLHLDTKICPVFTVNTQEVAFGRLHKGGAAFGASTFGGVTPRVFWRPNFGIFGISDFLDFLPKNSRAAAAAAEAAAATAAGEPHGEPYQVDKVGQ